MKEMKVIMAWKIFHDKGSYVPMESHGQYEIVYYLHGLGTSRIGGEAYPIVPNMFVVIPPGVPHDETYRSECELIFIRIQTAEPLPAGAFTDKEDQIYRLCQSIVDETMEQNLSYEDMIRIKLNELAITLERFSDNSRRHRQNKKFDYVINYLLENYHEKIQFRELARQMNFSYDYFQHRFKQVTGLSPQRFLIRRRVEMAQSMLADNAGNCTEIAQRCGFSNAAQFSAIFKRETGVPPRQWRRK